MRCKVLPLLPLPQLSSAADSVSDTAADALANCSAHAGTDAPTHPEPDAAPDPEPDAESDGGGDGGRDLVAVAARPELHGVLHEQARHVPAAPATPGTVPATLGTVSVRGTFDAVCTS